MNTGFSHLTIPTLDRKVAFFDPKEALNPVFIGVENRLSRSLAFVGCSDGARVFGDYEKRVIIISSDNLHIEYLFVREKDAGA